MVGTGRAGSDPEVARALGLAVAVEQHLLPRLGIDRAAAEHRVLAAGLVALVVGEGLVGARHRAVVLLDARLHLLEELLLQGLRRTEERRVGKECVRTCRFRWSRYHYTNKAYLRYLYHI